MRKPVTATSVLLLLVLVPSGVLAWLGYQSADAFDAAEANRLRDELETAALQVSAVAPQITTAIEADLQARVRTAADALAAQLPLLEPARAGALMRRLVNRGIERDAIASIRVRDAQGRSVLPREYTPVDRSVGNEPSQAGLIEDLRRRADRAYFGGGGLEDSLAVWSTARSRFGSKALRLLADVERARLRARADATGKTAAQEAERLDAAWSQADLIAAGRPLFLLWLAAAQADAHYAGRIGEGYQEGWADVTPLTREERARADLVAGQAGGYRVQGDDPIRTQAGGRPLPFSAPLPQGARLVVHLHPRALFSMYAVALDESWNARDLAAHPFILGQLLRAGPGVRLDQGLPRFIAVRARLPGAIAGGVSIQHLGWGGVRSARAARRFSISLGVVCLFLVTALGLFLIRRAIARERQARRTRDEFIANVTHEVRTPLTSVLLHSQLMADDRTAEDKRKQHAEVVQAQGRRLAALVDDMLDFARLERGTRTLEAVPVDLGAACREAIAPYLVLAGRDGVEVDCDVHGDEVAAMADPAALARILGNLVGNAWKHGRPARDEGACRIRVVAQEEGAHAFVEVRDNGPGIPAEERDRVFERFGRGRRSTRIEGSGIGLALAQDLAQALGGDLDVRDDGAETVFRLRLPAVPELGWEE